MIIIPKNGREQIHISREDFRGHDVVNLRVWYRADDGEMRPGKQGIAFRADLTPEVIAALEAVVNE